jgi:hypothetical protein
MKEKTMKENLRILGEDLWTIAWVSAVSIVAALAMSALGAGFGLWLIWLTR